MIKHSPKREAYKAPQCGFSAGSLCDLLCESPDGITEDFGDLVDFEW